MDPHKHLPKSRGQLPAAAWDALRRGQKIEAIKIVRDETRLGLKEAKELVEAHERAGADNHGEFTGGPQGALSPGETQRGGRGWLMWAVVVVVGVAVWWLMQ